MNKLETNYQGIPIPVDSTAGGIKSLLSGTVNPVSWLPSLLGFLAGPSRFIRGPLNSPYPHLGTYQPDSDGTETAPPSVQLLHGNNGRYAPPAIKILYYE